MAASRRVAVLGAGSWGTAVASIAARSADTVLWARRAELALQVAHEHRNSFYLPDLRLPSRLQATPSMAEAVRDAQTLVMAVPSHGFRDILRLAAPMVSADACVISLTKGLELQTQKRMTEIIAEEVPGRPAGVLTGPNLAREVVAGQPTASVVAVEEEAVAVGFQELMSTETFRVYTNDDVIGAEMAGALKNVMALAAGMADGMGLGDNSKAALITRGLAEMARLGVAMGGQPLTFLGLAGMGDLVATCYSPQSRNRHVGQELGRGKSLEYVIDSMRMVAEGVKTAPSALELGRRYGVDMPIVEQVVEVLDGRKTARQMIPALMRRQAKSELHGFPRPR